MSRSEMPQVKRVTLENVSKAYGSFKAVKDVSLAIEPGEFVTLLGPSGSGKTSTLMMVAGFESPSSGAIKVDGVDVVRRAPKDRNFGIVFQGYALFPHLSARQNVEFPLRMRGVEKSQRRAMALEMLEKVGLAGLEERRPRELSGGQQQRVALARALVFQPDALLLDEPLGALDKSMRERMQYEIKSLQRKLGISVLFVTHDQEEAMTMSDRIAVMNHGQIVQIGTPRELYASPRTPFVASFFGETNLLSCVADTAGTDAVTVTLASGFSFPAASDVERAQLSRNPETFVSIRPEKISVLAADERAEIMVDAVVREVAFLGKFVRVCTVASGVEITSIIGNAPERISRLAEGAAVRLGWSREDAKVLGVDVEPGDMQVAGSGRETHDMSVQLREAV
ncbi:ABC transporter ATP-binding protein [Caballeronia sp. LZ035]|uniref:ABC transporter ATP-binding protein n=1 Tax=Caballeronia sp. LZ035 TaxID=3038568 RepID=UPI00285F654E|nr:ABC transporter ATP-binding protein [Caballeronia sp. LZ035]MDR5758822.1 ABC transporter ATP-binding protein [Caballeronia sp. LZ035]